jgi:hypothetical protein
VAKSLPFQEKGQFQANIEDAVLNGERPIIPPQTEAEYKLLIEQCWKHSPEDRPDFELILQRLLKQKSLLNGTSKKQ